MPTFNPGGIQDRVDNRDFQWSEVGFGSAPFDWNVGFDITTKVPLVIKDQGNSGSCGGQAWAYQAEVLEAIATGTYEPRSAKYIYAQTYQQGGGSAGRDNANIFVNQGVSRESVLSSYDNGTPPTESFMERSADITDVARQNATFDKSLSYAQTGTNIDIVAQAMRDNNGVILGIDGQNNGTWLSAFPAPPTSTQWRHWIYNGKAKLINGEKFVGFANSWGMTVGEQGWQWLNEAYFTSGHVWSGWTHILAPVTPSFHHTFISDLHFGDSGVDIVALQTALQIDGEFPKTVPTTGFFGDITRRAVLSFRVKYGLSSATDPLGKAVGPITRGQLNYLFQ